MKQSSAATKSKVLETMRITLNMEDDLLDKAAMLSGVKNITTLVKRGLELLITIEAGKRLAHLAGTEKGLSTIPRRRMRNR